MMARKNKQEKYRKHGYGDPCDDNSERPWKKDLIVAYIFTGVISALYIPTVHPSVPGGDSGELITAAHELGVAHPPGYPLFTLLGKLFIVAIPWANPAWRMNLLNALLSAAAGGLLQLTVLRLTHSVPASLLSSGLFVFSKLTWTWAATVEVFSMNNLFIALLMLISVHFQQSRDEEKLMVSVVGAFVGGLSLCNQHTIVVYVLCLALWALLTLNQKQLLTGRAMGCLCAAFTLGLYPYLYLPISSWLNRGRWTWGDQTTIAGMITHLLRQEYGTWNLGKDQEGLGFHEGIKSYLEYLVVDYQIVGPCFAVVGLVVAGRRRGIGGGGGGGGVLFVFLCMMLLYACFFAWRANLDLSSPLLQGVVERFWLQTNMVLCVMIGVGYTTLMRLLRYLSSGKSAVHTLATWLSALLIVYAQWKRNCEVCDQKGNWVVHDFGKLVLNSMPNNSVILTKGDLPSNTLRYLHLCENIRPDIHLFDQEVLTYDWSVPKLAKFTPGLIFPGDFLYPLSKVHLDGRKSFTFKHFLDRNFGRHTNIFLCIGIQTHELSWQLGYELWPYGPCQKVVKKGTPFNPGIWRNATTSLADAWKYPVDSFERQSWEHVANNEMWHGRISSALYMFQQAAEVNDSSHQRELYVNAYHIYRDEMLKHKEGFPAYWHKNFALVCERLLRPEGHVEIPRPHLLERTAYHFHIYTTLNPDDPENPNILKALKGFHKQLEKLQKRQAGNKKEKQKSAESVSS